jgi:rhomboid family GlyGly-CTERM serine protease
VRQDHGGRRVAVALGVLCLLALLAGSGETLEFQRSAILEGAWWRVVTGHLVHHGYAHLLLNGAGAWLLLVVFREISWRIWGFIFLAAALAVSAGLLLETEPLDTYRGLSGVLFGAAAAAGVVRGRCADGRWLLLPALLVGAGLVDLLTFSGRTVGNGVPVHAAAHLYGLVGGVCAALLLVGRGLVGKRSPIRYHSAPRCAREPSW